MLDRDGVRKWLLKRQGLLEEALKEYGKRGPKTMSQEEVVTWLGFKAQWGLIDEMLREVNEDARKEYVKEKKEEQNE